MVEIPYLDDFPQRDFDGNITIAYQRTIVNKVTFSNKELRVFGLSPELNVLGWMQDIKNFVGNKSSKINIKNNL